MMRIFLFLVGSAIFLSGCVSNKKVLLLQKNDVNVKETVRDTVLRKYQPRPFDYRIQSNDALYVNIESLTPDEFNVFPSDASVTGGQNVALKAELVDPEGMIVFSVVGKVKVTGLTIFEVQDTLQSLANQYLKSAVVKVRLVNFRFTMLGEVGQEGTVTSPNNRISLPEAIGLGGGLSELADRKNVKIIRQKGDVTEVAYVNLLDENLMHSPFYYINQNDVIVVPPLRQRPFRKYFSQNIAIFLSATSVILLIASFTQN
jgi:polysaccharide biosynthesis/export protein